MRKTMTGLLLGAMAVAAAAPPAAPADRLSIQVGGAYFRPSEPVFREVYGSGGMSFGGEIGYTLLGGLGLWAGVDTFAKDGKTTLTEDATHIAITPLAGGIFFRLGRGRLQPYVAAGAGLFLYKESNVIGMVKKNDVGFVGKAGLRAGLFGPVFVDLQAVYESCTVEPAGVKADLGGIKARVGIGVRL